MNSSSSPQIALVTVALLTCLSAPNPTRAETVRYTNAVVFGQTARSFVTRSGLMIMDHGEAEIAADRVIDLEGAFVVPRLTDAHGHLLSLGRSMEVVDLRGCRSITEVVARLRAANLPKSGWISGRGWDQNLWKLKKFPTHEALSQAFGDRPVSLTRVDGHAIWVNRAAMAKAGVTSASQSEEGGKIIRDPDGSPSGVFVDSAMALVRKTIPKPDEADRQRWLLRAFAHANSLGLTSVHDMGMDAETLTVLKKLDASGRVPLRIYVYMDGLLDTAKPWRGANVRVVGVKLFADGALGSRGAALFDPYDDRPTQHGSLQFGDAALLRLVLEARKRGLQPAVHAIGDRAVRQVLHAYSQAEPGWRPPHWGRLPARVEHAQIVAEADLVRFAQLGVVASMQPTHATSDMGWAEARVGSTRIRGAYAWQRLKRAGATLAFGSDFPVESADPRLGIYAAVSRQSQAGEPPGGWRAEERMTIDDALTAFSVTPAQIVGDVAPYADFTVFAGDLRAAPEKDIPGTRVLRVVVAGKTVFKAAKR
ncbi:MAG: putative amidohydrolase YtcJ [Myxococcota bacterium]|jgi:predicted amidohydrolase YtcJ